MSKGEKEEKTTDPLLDTRLVVQKLGVWTALKERKGTFLRIDPRAMFRDFRDSYPPFVRLVQDVFRLEPLYLSIYFVYKLWVSVEPVVLFYFSSLILHEIETSLKERSPNVEAITFAVGARLGCVTLTAAFKSLELKITPRLRSSLELYFEEVSLRSKLNCDLPTSQEHSGENGRSHRLTPTWHSVMMVSEYLVAVVNAVAHIFFISQSSMLSSPGLLFALICLLHPLAQMMSERSFWRQDSLYFTSNDEYNRMKALQKLSEEKYKKDVLSGDIADYITAKHDRSRQALRGTPVGHFWDLQRNSPMSRNVCMALLADLPMVYYAAQTVLNPSKFSMATIAILQQSHSALRNNFFHVLHLWSLAIREGRELKHAYSTLEINNSIVDGDLSYPVTEEEKYKGMEIELKNVSFKYPGTKSESNALDDVCLSIKPGSLVVVVGSNGSGKSTLVNILTRLYDVTSGSVLINSHRIQSYRLADLRKSTAVLTQDHELFPLSIHENIGLGNSTKIDDNEVVMDSARRGGAVTVLSKFKDGLQTVLEPTQRVENYISPATSKDHPLNVVFRALPKPSEVSGGEKQRLVASRMFMRFTSGQVRLVCVDEPSSALDPEAEFQLFNNLRQVREGKTMIFVTHRFGHLARYADLILYMEDGKIAEQGTHEELMKEDGGYAHQYNIQASAFVTQDKPT